MEVIDDKQVRTQQIETSSTKMFHQNSYLVCRCPILRAKYCVSPFSWCSKDHYNLQRLLVEVKGDHRSVQDTLKLEVAPKYAVWRFVRSYMWYTDALYRLCFLVVKGRCSQPRLNLINLVREVLPYVAQAAIFLKFSL